MIQIHFFARIRELVNTSSVEIDENVLNLSFPFSAQQLVHALVKHDSKYQPLLENELLCAINQTLLPLTANISDNNEIAFFPPVTGG